MSDNVRFVHLTDLHVSEPSTPDPGLLSDTSMTLRAVLADVKRLQPPPAFIVVSGDLTNRGDTASYELVKAIFTEAALDMPVLFALGNHDNRPAFYAALLGDAGRGSAPYDHDAVISGIHVVVLDSSVAGQIGGDLSSDQFDWLAERLDAHTGIPKLIVVHHAPMLDEDDPAAEWEALTVEATQRLRQLLAPRRDVVGIMSGHVHYDRVSNWHGIPTVVGIGQHNATDVCHLGQGLRLVSGASFVVGTLRRSGLTVAFAPQPSDRHELGVIGPDRLAMFNQRRAAPEDVSRSG